MTGRGNNKASAFAANEVAAAEVNFKAAQARLVVARQRFMQSSSNCSSDARSDDLPDVVCGSIWKERCPVQQDDASAGIAGHASASAYCSREMFHQAHASAATSVAAQTQVHASSSCASAQSLPQWPDQMCDSQNIAPAKDHIAAGILAIFLGLFGIHKFYMGFTNEGFIMLGITVVGSLATFGAAALIVQLIAVVEGLIYLLKTQNQFEQDYVYGRRSWL